MIPIADDAIAVMNKELAEKSTALCGTPTTVLDGMPIVYVVGCPRSGTTLAHQLFARCLTLDYVDQVVARFWRAPAFGLALSKQVLGEDRHERIRFESELGVTNGPDGPHEFGFFWNHWMRFDHSRSHRLSEAELGKVDHLGLRDTIRCQLLSMARGEGFLFKNLTCGLQARWLTGLHQQSLFVYLDRDVPSVARSLLHWRSRRGGDMREWLSLKPSSFPYLASQENPVAQVLGQVVDSKREIETELGGVDVRSVKIDFQDMLSNPGDAVETVAEALSKMGASVGIRDGYVPEGFPSLPIPGLHQDVEDALREGLRSFS